MKEKRNNASLLKKRITLQALTETSDGAGGFTSSWQTTATIWAQVETTAHNGSMAGGNENFRSMQIQNNQLYRITIRYMSPVTTAMRVVVGSRVFNIRRVNDKDEAHHMLELIAEEGVAV